MKAVIYLIFVLTVIPVSIMTMIYGWGIQPENWGWIAFGYVWSIIPGLIAAVFNES